MQLTQDLMSDLVAKTNGLDSVDRYKLQTMTPHIAEAISAYFGYGTWSLQDSIQLANQNNELDILIGQGIYHPAALADANPLTF